MTSYSAPSVAIKNIELRSSSLMQIIERSLPEQGAIEVQHDQSYKEHPWHCHETDETIIILKGSLQFKWEDETQICNPGTVIELPKGQFHGSVAMENGATYVIAFHKIDVGA